jgi:hypothetical protein
MSLYARVKKKKRDYRGGKGSTGLTVTVKPNVPSQTVPRLSRIHPPFPLEFLVTQVSLINTRARSFVGH